jgi:hypothetical protein
VVIIKNLEKDNLVTKAFNHKPQALFLKILQIIPGKVLR